MLFVYFLIIATTSSIAIGQDGLILTEIMFNPAGNENFNEFTAYSYSWGGMMIAIFVIPIILLFIGSTSFYYGIKIIQNNN